MFDVSYCEQGRNFANKIWNAFRLLKSWELNDQPSSEADLQVAEWFENRFNSVILEIEDHFNNYRLSDALMSIYKLVWDDFCSWYLEWVKPAYQQSIAQETFDRSLSFFERILTLIHPFMPFISEELWHDDLFGERDEMDCCIVAPYPKAGEVDEVLLDIFKQLQAVISEVRNIRNAKQISPKEALTLYFKAGSTVDFNRYGALVSKLANLSEFAEVAEKPAGAISFLIGRSELYTNIAQSIDVDAERERIEKEIGYLNGFLKGVNAKLSNEKFVQNAKAEIVENEKNKKADAEAKIASLQEALAAL